MISDTSPASRVLFRLKELFVNSLDFFHSAFADVAAWHSVEFSKSWWSSL